MADFPRIPGYRVKKVLGEGGMSTVYLGIQKKLKREVAIKVMDPYFLKDSNFSRRFLREAETAANLFHSNIVSIFDVGQTGDIPYIVMEFLSESLKERMRAGPDSRMQPRLALTIVKEIADALDHAHRQGFIHRDIKPDNIMFREDGTPVLVDFGIARAVDSDTKLTRTGMSIGTPHYMSPEQCRAEKIDGRSDLYSLGVVLFEMMTGRLPFSAENEAGVLLKQIQEPVPRMPAVAAPYQPLIDILMDKDREKRIQNGRELIDMINTRFQPDRHPPVGEGPRAGRDKSSIPPELQFAGGRAAEARSPRRWPLPAAVATAILLAAAGIFVKYVLDRQPPDRTGETTPGVKQQQIKEQIKDEPPGKPPTVPREGKKASMSAKSQKDSPEAAEPEKKINIRMQEDASSGKGTEAEKSGEKERKSQPTGQEREGADVDAQKEAVEPAAPGKQLQPGVVKAVKIFSIPSDFQKNYKEKMKRIEIPGLAEGIKVSGQIGLALEIDEEGKLYVRGLYDRYFTVSPASKEDEVRNMILDKIHTITVLPPKDREGSAVRVEGWRLNFKVATFQGKIILH